MILLINTNMKKIAFLLTFFVFQKQISKAQTTRYRATIKIESGILPFGLELQKKADNTYQAYILNASEKFQTDDAVISNDSLRIPILLFDAEIVAKMVEGTAAKFLKEVALLSQPFVKDDSMTIEALLKSRAAVMNGFNLYLVGEGIEKKVTDFAAEVAEATAAAQAAQAAQAAKAG